MYFNKYRSLRNKVNSKIRKDSTDFNNNRIDEAGDENEVWKVAKGIINPNTETDWSMNINNKKTEDKEEIANAFNTPHCELPRQEPVNVTCKN